MTPESCTAFGMCEKEFLIIRKQCVCDMGLINQPYKI